MKKVKTEKAVGKVLAHDITEIIPRKKKGVAFQRGRVIEEGDIERLLNLGKEHLYVFDGEPKGVHEDEAGARIARAVMDQHMEPLSPKEGKVSITSKVDGFFYVNRRYLYEINRVNNVLLSTIPDKYPVRAGDTVAAARIIPLYIRERELEKIESIGKNGVLWIKPFEQKEVGLVITGSEVFSGRIKDASGVVEHKLKNYGLKITEKRVVPDSIVMIRNAIIELFEKGAEIIVTTGGLSVDPDDVTKEGIESAGAKVLFYGTPIFPGAMFLVARMDGRYILGSPACVYYNRFTALDVVLPRILAGEELRKQDVAKLAYGGLCLQCDSCHYPACYFGRGL